eukprot:Em0014g224a
MTTLTAVLTLAITCTCALLSGTRADSCDYQGAQKAYEELLSIISPGGQKGCCPKIVPQGGITGSLITRDTGYRGDVAIIVDWGTCTAQPAGGFLWYVSWGDGTYSFQKTATLGPFQDTHQYSSCQKSYPVYAYYCSTPPFPAQPCCDVIYGTIDAAAN